MLDNPITLKVNLKKEVEAVNFSCVSADFTTRVVKESKKYLPAHRLIQQRESNPNEV